MGFAGDVEKWHHPVWKHGLWEELLLEMLESGEVFVVVAWAEPSPN